MPLVEPPTDSRVLSCGLLKRRNRDIRTILSNTAVTLRHTQSCIPEKNCPEIEITWKGNFSFVKHYFRWFISVGTIQRRNIGARCFAFWYEVGWNDEWLTRHWMNGWMIRLRDGWMDGWMKRWIDYQMNEWLDGWMNGWMIIWMNEWMDELMGDCMDEWRNG